MSTTTYTIFQSNNKEQVNGTITMEVTDESAGTGNVSMLIGGVKFAATMDNWTCYDDKNEMIWVFYPDAQSQRDRSKYPFPSPGNDNPDNYNTAIGYTFVSYPKVGSEEPMIPPNKGSGTGGGD